MRATATVLVLIGLSLSSRSVGADSADADYAAVRNLVSNPSFEMDWMHNSVTVQTRFSLLEQSDWGYGQSDGQPDCWMLPATTYRDPTTARFGKASLRLQGSASQVVYLCGETDPADGGSNYNAFRPLPAALTRSIKARPLRCGAWCKTHDAAGQPTLTVIVEYARSTKITARRHAVAFDKGGHDWQYREITIPPVSDLGVPHAAVVQLTYQGAGTAWFDGVLLEETVSPDEVNLLPDDGFERLEKSWPAGWKRPVLWSWSRREYYRFTGWSHEKGKMAGGAAAVPLGHGGSRSLQLTVLPGDNLAVRSAPIRLNQTEARVLEVSAWVRADDLRWLEIMAQDEKGEWLPQQDFLGFMGTDEQYRNRVLGIGSHDWEFVRKHFAPRRPVKELTLFLCARGFDGKMMARNVVGTVWFDDVELRERGTPRAELVKRGITIPAPRKPPAKERPYRIVSLDLGERLWGYNTLRLRLQNPGGAAVSLDTRYPLTEPSGQTRVLKGKLEALPARGETEVIVPYRLTELAADWQQHYRLEQPWPLVFGTPPSPIGLRLNASYVYPDEKLAIGINLAIAEASLKDVASCRVVVLHPKGEKELLRTRNVSRAFWSPGQERPALLVNGYVDAHRLIALDTDGTGLPLHPSTNPVRDCRVQVTLTDRNGKVLATQQSEPFGFMQKPLPPVLPDRITRTQVVEGGTILVNGRPFVFNCFPFRPTDLGGIDRTINFPKTHKILPLPFPKTLTFPAAEDAAWKRKVQDFVKAHKNDPKLFGYFFNHDGETTFWLKEWKEMAACQRKVAVWVREIDPNHLILSASWLFGHEALTPETGRHFDFLDVIDEESGLTWTPDSHAVRKAARRPVAVVSGLECYYFQPINVLRWRVYEALRQGANGIGICPSGMLIPRPEIVSALRGLHGEIQGLEGLLTGKVPAQAARASTAALTVWERRDGKTRYLVAMLGDRKLTAKERRVTFTLPFAARKAEVLFEGRSLTIEQGRLTDDFEAPFTVRVYRMMEE